MFAETSRYSKMETASYFTPDGEKVMYKRRRFLPRGEELQLLVEVKVTEGDRLDNITAKTLGDPEQFWQVCDANNTMNPNKLTEEVGTVIRVPIPQL